MKSKNILADIKSKSIKEAKEEINDILNKLEKNDANLNSSMEDYQRLIQLNNHVDDLFKKKFKEISLMNRKIKKK
jgi:exonuclease VII small subunit